MENKESSGREKEMSFLDHLEELRWHIIRSLIAIFVFGILAFLAKSFIFGTVILGPSKPDFWTYRMLCKAGELINSEVLCIKKLDFIIQSRKMTGQVTMHITSSFVIGLIMAFPYAFWEMWRFVSPGLYENERKVSRGATFYVSLLFIVGVLFGYYIITPLSVNFLAGYSVDPSIFNEFDLTSYVSTVTMLVLACAFLFQLPIIVYFLTKAGMINPSMMRHYRKHAIVVILILGALLTPPEPVSQVLIAIPLFGLYQLSIFISSRVIRSQRKKEKSLENE